MEKNYTEGEILKLIQAHRSQIKHIRHLRDDDHYYESSIATVRTNMDRLQKELERLEYYRTFADRLVEETEARISELRKHLTLVQHRSKLERLLRIKEAIDEIQSEDV